MRNGKIKQQMGRLLILSFTAISLTCCKKEPAITVPESQCNVSTLIHLRQGYKDGNISQAAAKSIDGIVFDTSDNLCFVDKLDNRIRKITPDGVVSTVAGNGELGFKDGPVGNAQFYAPKALTLDNNGNLYVAQSFAIRKISPDGNITTIVGAKTVGLKSTQIKGDTTNLPLIGDSFLFESPQNLSFDKVGSLFVAEGGNNARIIKITPNKQVSVFAGTPFALSTRTVANTNQLRGPNGLAFDNQGNLLISDSGLGIIKLTPDGSPTYFTGSGYTGHVDGPAKLAKFSSPTGAVFDKAGNLYVGDDMYIRKITPDGTVTTIAGSGNNNRLNTESLKDGPGNQAQISNPTSLAFDSKGNLYVVDDGGIRKIEFK